MIEFSQQKVRQYLVHSFLYYQLGESIISDMQYDQICVEVETYLRRMNQILTDFLLTKLNHVILIVNEKSAVCILNLIAWGSCKSFSLVSN